MQNPNGAEIFKKISEAYSVLSDEVKRRHYDRHGHDGLSDEYSYEEAGFGFMDAAQIFQMFFDTGVFVTGSAFGHDKVRRTDVVTVRITPWQPGLKGFHDEAGFCVGI